MHVDVALAYELYRAPLCIPILSQYSPMLLVLSQYSSMLLVLSQYSPILLVCAYRIALIFRGSNISRKAVFDIFVEIISRKRSAHPRA